jgi:carbamoyl-phosphate synthase large subunit
VLEVNPRASRTVPFVSKATGVPLAKIAARCMVGRTLREQGLEGNRARLLLGQGSDFPVRQVPERRSDPGPGNAFHRRSHGRGRSFGEAFARAEEAANIKAPQPGKAFISVRDPDKARVLPVASYDLLERGFSLVATGGTARA